MGTQGSRAYEPEITTSHTHEPSSERPTAPRRNVPPTSQSRLGNRAAQQILRSTSQATPTRPTDTRLPNSLASAMQRSLGFDVSQLPVTSDAPLPADVAASATGQELRFAAGRYRPDTSAGRWLIAHELAHVGQQLRGARGITTGDQAGREAEADQAATAAMLGHPVALTHAAPFGQPQHKLASDELSDEELAALLARVRNKDGQIAPVILPAAAPGPTIKEKNPPWPIAVTNPAGSSGLTALERTGKRSETYHGGPGSAGDLVRSVEDTQSALVNQAGKPVVTKEVASDKTSRGVTFASKEGTTLPNGTPVTGRDEEMFIGSSEKTARNLTRNAAATSETSTFKTFNGTKLTINGFDAGGDFNEHEEITGRESRRVLTNIESRNTKDRVVATERGARTLTTEGTATVALRNTGTKYQALDLDRVEVLRGVGGAPARRVEHIDREIDHHKDGTRQRERSSNEQRGEVTTREQALRLEGGRERRITGQSSRGTATSNKLSELENTGRSFTGKASTDASYGLRSNTALTINKPGATPIAPRVQQGTAIGGGQLGLLTPSAPDKRLVVTGDKQAFTDPKNTSDASYTETLAFTDNSRVTKTDNYAVTDRGVSANLALEAEAGTLRSWTRGDRFNFGWIVVENALTDYYLAGVNGKLAGGAQVGRDVNNVNASAGASAGWTRRLSDEVTIRAGGFFLKLKADADAFAGVEAALSAEAGYTRGAGAGGAVGANAFAGARVGIGGKLEGGLDNISFAAGAYKLRGSAGVGFKGNLEARYQNGYLLLSGGLALSAELGLGADIELRINPTAVAAAVVKRAASVANLDVAGTATAAARGVASGARRAYRWASSLTGR